MIITLYRFSAEGSLVGSVSGTFCRWSRFWLAMYQNSIPNFYAGGNSVWGTGLERWIGSKKASHLNHEYFEQQSLLTRVSRCCRHDNNCPLKTDEVVIVATMENEHGKTLLVVALISTNECGSMPYGFCYCFSRVHRLHTQKKTLVREGTMDRSSTVKSRRNCDWMLNLALMEGNGA